MSEHLVLKLYTFKTKLASILKFVSSFQNQVQQIRRKGTCLKHVVKIAFEFNKTRYQIGTINRRGNILFLSSKRSLYNDYFGRVWVVKCCFCLPFPASLLLILILLCCLLLCVASLWLRLREDSLFSAQ